MSAPTPGPWRVCVDDDLTFVCHEEVQEMRPHDHCGLLMVVHDGTEADARLAAAAPDLLALLVSLRDEWFEPHYGQNDVGMAVLLRDKIRAAIAKAEGK